MRLRALLNRIDMTNVALLAGGVLLWIGLSYISDWLPFVVVGALLLLYGSLPVAIAVSRRRR